MLCSQHLCWTLEYFHQPEKKPRPHWLPSVPPEASGNGSAFGIRGSSCSQHCVLVESYITWPSLFGFLPSAQCFQSSWHVEFVSLGPGTPALAMDRARAQAAPGYATAMKGGPGAWVASLGPLLEEAGRIPVRTHGCCQWSA